MTTNNPYRPDRARRVRPDMVVTAAQDLRGWILAEQYSFVTESQLQDRLQDRILEYPKRLTHVREAALGDYGRDRIDFHVDAWTTPDSDVIAQIGVEVKVAGSLSMVGRQWTRYARYEHVDALLLVTCRASHHHVPTEIEGTPVLLCSLVAGAL